MARRTYNGRNYQNKNFQDRNYVDGSLARRIDYSAVPKKQEEISVPVRRRKEKPLSKRQQKELMKETSRAKYRQMNSQSMSLGSVIFMTVMVAVIFALGVTYLNYQAQISNTKDNINELKENVEVLSSQNDAVAYDIEAYIDINHIINVATSELGMVRASEAQIKYFEKNMDEFMNQYADVPEE